VRKRRNAKFPLGHENCIAKTDMKKIKFSGREVAVLRAIDFSLGSTGGAIMERTRLEAEETLDIVNSLMDTGYIETNPPCAFVEVFALFDTLFEINPAYVHDLRQAIIRR
jgi:hypothetical protein